MRLTNYWTSPLSRWRILSLVAVLLLASLQISAKVVDVTEASKMAAAYLSPKSQTHGQPMRVKQIKLSASSRLMAPAAEEPAFYIFTSEEGKGFAIVSADDVATPVLGYSDTNSFDPDNIPPALEELMSQWTEQIRLARSQGLEPTAEIKAKWAKASPSKAQVLLETAEWAQSTPYNNDCPIQDGYRCVTGCNATQLAILMRYYKYARPVVAYTPPYTSGAYVPMRKIDGNYDWDNMPLTYPWNGYGDERDAAVAKLMADLGALLRSYYGVGSTYASTDPDVFDLFGYQYEKPIARYSFTDDEWNEKLMHSLDERHPVLYHASGHAFILDGYNEDGYYHANLGWGGSSNGFFELNALNFNDTTNTSAGIAYVGVCPIDDTDYEISDIVATVGDLSFSEAQNALTYAAGTGEELTFLKDVSIADRLYVGVGSLNKLCVNLNGHTLKLFDIQVSSGELTLKDSPGGGGKIEFSTLAEYPLQNYGTMLIENVAISGGNDNIHWLFYNEGNAIIRRCTISANVGQEIISNTGQCDIYDSEITCLNNGFFVFAVNGVTNIYSGKFFAPYGCYVYEGGPINVYGGLFSFDPSEFVAEGGTVSANTDPETSAKYPYSVYNPNGALGSLSSDSTTPVAHYTIDGRKVDTPLPGTLIITMMSDGSVTKSLWK
ncbi:MAG: C10 family peptidase [Bacteroidaceae bacterium]|nr:C10 family peptidase [Bacteroidaceae bacterium]